MVARYVKFLVPGLFTYEFLQNGMRFMQAQSAVVFLAVLSAVPLLLHLCLAYAFVNWTSLGLERASLVVSISSWVFLLLSPFVCLHLISTYEVTWIGFSVEAVSCIFINLKLAMPSAAMVWALAIFRAQEKIKVVRKNTLWKSVKVDTRTSYTQTEMDEMRVEWAEFLGRYI